MHVIQKHLVELEIPNDQQAFTWHQRISHLVQDQLTPALSQLFDREAGSRQVLRLDRLAITIHFQDAQFFEQRFANEVVKAVEAELKRFEEAQPYRLLDDQERKLKAFVHFLQHGYLPWWAVFDSHDAFQQLVAEAFDITASPETKLKLQAALQNRGAAERLVYQFHPDLVQATLNQIASTEEINWLNKLEEIWFASGQAVQVSNVRLRESWHDCRVYFIRAYAQNKPAPAYRVPSMLLAVQQKYPALWKSNFLLEFVRRYQLAKPEWPLPPDLLASLHPSGYATQPFPEQVTDFPETEKLSESATARPPENTPDAEDNGVYVQNSGLILLAPYLPMYLEACSVAEGDILTKPLEAVHVLQYLVSGLTQTPEYELALNKVLCGLPLTEGLPLAIETTERLQTEAQQLLESVIRYWETLKNTSPAGLQEAFLQRSGKLQQKIDGDWLLQIEQKSYDILLDQLPWPYNMVKLPWMETLLWVEYS